MRRDIKPLTKAELRQIIDLLLRDIVVKIEEKGAQFIITDAAKEIILKEGYNVKYGARPLKRAIQKVLEDQLAKLSLHGQIQQGSIITADADGDTVNLTIS